MVRAVLILSQYNVKDKCEITPSEYLAALRVLHIVLKKDTARNNGVVNSSLRDSLKILELYAPVNLSNVINLLYNSK